MSLIKSLLTRKKRLLEDAQFFPIPIVNFEKKYIFYWSAKSGCTQATKIILDDIGIKEPHNPSEFPTDHPNYVDDLRKTYYSQFNVDIKTAYDCSRDKNFIKFKLVRHPKKRLVSAFIMLMKHYKNYRMDDTGLLGEISRSTQKDILQLSFFDFCTYLSRVDIQRIDWHVQIQTHPFETSKRTGMDEILRLESFDTDFNSLNQSHGLDIFFSSEENQFQHYNKPKDNHQRYVSDIPYVEYSNDIPKYDYFYDDESDHIVRNKYASDFNLYGYK